MINFANKKILVVAAHPDDEILGCGGTLARAASEGAEISIILLGEGPTSRMEDDAEAARAEAIHSAEEAARIVGAGSPIFGNLPDNKFDSAPLLDVVRIIERESSSLTPDIIFTHHYGDLNIDHSVTNRAVLTAFRPLPGTRPTTILGFEILSSTEYTPPATMPAFTPSVYIDITSTLKTKLKALRAYEKEMRPWPHPRSYHAVEQLNTLRGTQCGTEAAEAFILYRATI